MDRRRRRHLVIVTGAMLAAPMDCFAQPAPKVRRIGYLSNFAPSKSETGLSRQTVESFRRAGYVMGRNIVIESRFAAGSLERLPQLAEELVRLDVELIITVTDAPTEAASRATRTIPIVMYAGILPVEMGLARSLARPGGNVTGILLYAQLNRSLAKHYQLLKEAVPGAKRAAALSYMIDPAYRFIDFQQIENDVAAMGMALTRIPLNAPSDVDAALKRLTAAEAEVVFVSARSYGLSVDVGRKIVDFATKIRLITISDGPRFVDIGGLLSYGPDFNDVTDRMVSYVDRILRGAKPGDLPIEQAQKYVMRMNGKTARAIGFKPPEAFLRRVDEVVE